MWGHDHQMQHDAGAITMQKSTSGQTLPVKSIVLQIGASASLHEPLARTHPTLAIFSQWASMQLP